MKPLLLLALLSTAASLQADVVIEQKLESAAINGVMTMKIKGDHARMDMPSPAGQMSAITDLKAGQIVTLLPAQKMAMKMSIDDAKKAAQGQVPDATAAPKDTGKKEKVGDYDCEIYTIDAAGTTATMWVAKGYPNYKKFLEETKKLSALSQTGIDPNKFDLGGMVVKTEMNTAIGKMSMTLISAKEEPVPDSEFVVPQGYTEMQMPGRK